MGDRRVLASKASTKHLLYEAAVNVLVAASPAMLLADNGTVAWWWFATGVFAMVLTFGASRTSIGRRLWKGFERIGKGDRLVVIAVAALVIWGAMSVLDPPVVPGASFLLGSAAVLVIGTVLRLLRRITVDGRRQPA